MIFLLAITIGLTSCKSEDDNYSSVGDLYEEGEEYLTGTLGVNSTSANAFGFEIDGLSFTEIGQFSTGNSLFNQNWVSAPASTTARDGLGPTFNARACAGCHFKDGRGGPLVNGQNSDGFLMRISMPGQDIYGNNNPVPNYGTQLQDRANNDIPYEAKVNVTYEYINGEYADGTTYQLQKPIYSFSDEQFGSLAGVQMSPRVAQQTIGLGLVSALPDSEILQFADEFDADNDGISGKPNYVYDVETETDKIGKYGWKANMPTLKQQIAGAMSGDMGLTTSLFPETICPSPQQDCIDAPNGGEPEVTDEQLERVLFYQSTLAVPNRRNVTEESVLKGKVLFNALNCITCHAINQTTGTSAVSSLLENVTIRPYSDFLLHDMGDDLADNRPDFDANGNEWRTQPLWGIGLISTVNDHTFLLHDGRARNVEEAILWHGGEAETIKNAFKNLTEAERQNVIDFVNSL
ncbi:di-heme oxidoreductase family protein [Winogradskyella endarachnes]|uniref:C-type cytochrome n=1 Tax=Winogradskyella endarachnes TaxID=2681965 RepID=A0A6L6UG73_9FLAO|nr:di-heme oxidoredictase family protein [Winogradskyella endarachnes]MUU79787.1 c-type cytochrome [Winogradskyella endarachnes]